MAVKRLRMTRLLAVETIVSERLKNQSAKIATNLRFAREGDVIVLCGKGHETYQIIGDEKIHYDEREIVKRILDKHK